MAQLVSSEKYSCIFWQKMNTSTPEQLEYFSSVGATCFIRFPLTQVVPTGLKEIRLYLLQTGRP